MRLFLAAVGLLLLLADGSWAGGYGTVLERRVHPDFVSSRRSSSSSSFRGIVRRQVLQGVEQGMNVTNSPTFNSVIVPLTLSNDQKSYYTIIQAGNTSFRIALDTASADLWLVSSDCNTPECSPLPKYQLGYESPTFVSVNLNQTTFNTSFADGTTVGGFVAMETIQLSNLTVANQAFGVVTDTNVTSRDKVSGILGLGFPRLSRIFNTVVNATPFLATMAQRGQLDYPLFGLSLPHNSSAGSLTFGAIDASVVTNLSLIEWHEVVPFAPFGSENNVSTYLQWVIPLRNISINGSAIAPQPTYPIDTSNISLALFDVGTSGIFGPYQDVSRLFSSIVGARLVDTSGQWIVPCDANETISFQFGQQQFVLQPTDYMIGPTSADPGLCLSWPRASNPSADGIDWQFGAAFLRTVYSVFSLGIDDKEPPMIGLFPLHNISDPIESQDTINSYFSTASATIATTLPNFLLPTPSFSTLPSYLFNTSIPASQGEIVSSGLATSTYSPVLDTHHLNATALATLSPSPTLFTLVVTDGAGHVETSVSTASVPTVTLGTPPGWTSSSGAVNPLTSSMDFLGCFLLFFVLFCSNFLSL